MANKKISSVLAASATFLMVAACAAQSNSATDLSLIGAERVVRCIRYSEAIVQANNYIPEIANRAAAVSVAYRKIAASIPDANSPKLWDTIGRELATRAQDQILVVVTSCHKAANSAP
jgi:1-aminocyclopropane-1-carboxylate deaminase/D-cysteine desulfhydrase-like pyridoxal-dependent ACC family enzyme